MSGIAHSSRTTYSHTTEKTALAEKLRSPWMPQEPILPKKRELGCLTWILILFAFFPFVGLLVVTYFYFFNPQELAKQQIDPVIIQQCVVWPFVAVLVTLIQVISNKSKTKEEILAYDQQMLQYKNAMLYWKQAYRRWETMYYCYRDHVIFILWEPQFANPDQIVAFCYQHTE